MSKPSNNSNITVSEETHDRLTKIRDHNHLTYTETIDKLCELYFRDNEVQFKILYELHTQEMEDKVLYNNVYRFKVIFRNDGFTVEYFNLDKSSTDDITKWDVVESIQKTFYEFIHQDSARTLLLYMPIGMMFEDFEIYKVKTIIND